VGVSDDPPQRTALAALFIAAPALGAAAENCGTVTEGKCVVTMTGVKAVTATFDELE
jgi:hypothetical protein